MSARLLAGVLLCGLSVSAQPRGDSGTILVSLIDRPVGREVYRSIAGRDGTVFSAELDLTERNARLQVSSSLRLGADLTPLEFTVKGKSYRFVNVDAAVKVAGGVATVTSLGETTTFEAPRRFFTAQSYAPLSARAQLIDYWDKHGRPASLPVIPGEPTREVRIEQRGIDTIATASGGRSILRRFSVDGIVWGRETVWLDSAGRFAAIVSRIHILPLEGVRDDLKDSLPALQASAIADRINDLAQHRQSIAPVTGARFAITNARLIDGTGRPPIANAVVIVRDGRIAAAGARASTPIPAGTPLLDLSGATVVPGLWDMHAHASQIEWLPAYLAAGVTTIRDMGGQQPFVTALRDTVASGQGLGPRVLLAGLVDGDAAGGFGATVASTPAQGRAIVDRYKAAGFNQIKLYTLLRPEVVAAINARAHALGMSVTGHVPAALGLTKAIEAGMDHVAHLPINGDPQSPQIRATIALLAQHQTVIDPTLPWSELLGYAPETTLESFEPGFKHAPPALRANYRSVKNDTDAVSARRRVRESGALVKALFDAGVPIIAGTDGALPGYSLLRSLELFVEAGLTPMQAIESATRVPAQSIGLGKESGTIEPGKRADMIVLNADPLASISNIRQLRLVIANGRALEPAKLWAAAGFK